VYGARSPREHPTLKHKPARCQRTPLVLTRFGPPHLCPTLSSATPRAHPQARPPSSVTSCHAPPSNAAHSHCSSAGFGAPKHVVGPCCERYQRPPPGTGSAYTGTGAPNRVVDLNVNCPAMGRVGSAELPSHWAPCSATTTAHDPSSVSAHRPNFILMSSHAFANAGFSVGLLPRRQ
jgi:hypothetical protein